MKHYPSEFRVGERVQIHPATDGWAMGIRYGDVTKLGRKLVHVKFDQLRWTLGIKPELLLHAES